MRLSNAEKWERKSIEKSRGVAEVGEVGFTLLEVLAVLFLLGILLLGVTPYFKTSVQFTRQKAHQANIKKIEGAAQIYRLDNGVFPGSVEDLFKKPAGLNSWRGPYLDYLPVNPFDPARPYQIDAQGNVK